jgi:hypothetical protein
MDEPVRHQHRDDVDMRALWSEAIWGAGLIGAVIAMVSLIATLGR